MEYHSFVSRLKAKVAQIDRSIIDDINDLCNYVNSCYFNTGSKKQELEDYIKSINNFDGIIIFTLKETCRNKKIYNMNDFTYFYRHIDDFIKEENNKELLDAIQFYNSTKLLKKLYFFVIEFPCRDGTTNVIRKFIIKEQLDTIM